MTRYILCDKCRFKLTLHPEDKAMEFKERRIDIIARKPVDHFITLTTGIETGQPETKREDLPSLRCDACNESIPDGSKALAVTFWRGQEPEFWEHEYDAQTP